MGNITIRHPKSIVNELIESIKNSFQLIKNGHYSIFFQELKKRFYSTSVSVGLRRSMNTNFQSPDAKIRIYIRSFEPKDFNYLMENGKLEKDMPRFVESHRSLVKANIPQCYVAVTENNEPCFIQWLIGFESNELMKERFGNSFPELKKDEALLEGAYMHRSFRGLGIMPAAMSLITEKAREKNVKWVLTFVDIENIPSLKGCKRSGFSPYILKNDRWFLFRRFISFQPLTKKHLLKYSGNTE